MDKQELLDSLENSYQELNFLTSDIQTVLNQEINRRNPKALAIQNWFNNITSVYFSFKNDIINDNITYYSFDDVGDIPYTINELYEHVQENKNSDYRIAPHVDIDFIDERIHLVDFKRNLKANIALVKTTFRLPNGRPSHNEYFYNSLLMAKICFIFEVDANNLLTRRTEKLCYIKNDGSNGNEIIIKDKLYDMSNIADASIVVQERVSARQYIVNSLNIFILGVLRQYHPDKTQDECIIMMLPYWNENIDNRLMFIDLGLPDWKNSLIELDMNNLPSENQWLAYVIDAEGTTVRDYAYFTLNY